MDWKGTVVSVTEKVFPGIAENVYDKIVENEVMSNLPLQMSLYFNVVFLPVWLIMLGLLLYDKVNTFNEFTLFVLITIIIAIVVLEVLRMYLGHEGNLRDKIPELAGFWMISVFLQFPLQGFLLFNRNFLLRPLDLVVQTVMFSLLTVQLMSAFSALRYTSKRQTAYIRIMKLRNETGRDKYYRLFPQDMLFSKLIDEHIISVLIMICICNWICSDCKFLTRIEAQS